MSRFVGRLAWLFSLAALAASSQALAQQPVEKPKTVRLLTVGNSFSRDATTYLDELAKGAGDVLIHHQAAIGGGTLEQHCEKFQRHEKDPKDPAGLYTTKKSLKEELTAEPWDFITIQQASIKSHDISTYEPFAHELRDYIKKYAPDATLIVHETWAYRRDDPRFFAASPAPGEPVDQKAMYEGLSQAYRTIAGQLGTRLIPVGDALYMADTDPKWGYRVDTAFDFQTAAYPNLPDQTHSLHVGWRWVPAGKDGHKLAMDGHHASAAGRYLGSCVFYDVLFGKSVVGNPFHPKEIDPDYARFLQETAHRAAEAERAREREAGGVERAVPVEAAR